MRGKKVVIIGAGCAGLSATYTLRKQGINVVTFEADDAAGGRCRSVEEKGYTFSIGAGATEPQWHTTFQYLDELELMDKVFHVKQQRYIFVRNGEKHSVFLRGNFIEMLKTVPEDIRFGLTAFPLKTYPQLFKVILALRKYMKLVDNKNQNFDALSDISNTSTAEFALKHGGPEVVNYIFHPFLATMTFGRPEEVSIAHPISLFALMQGMCSLDGGLGIMTAALYDEVKDCVKLSTPIKKVVIENNKVMGVETMTGFVEASHVICATDAVRAMALIPGLPDTIRQPLETCKYSCTYNYMFVSEKKIVPNHFFALMIPASEDTIINSIYPDNDERTTLHVTTRCSSHQELIKLTEEERRRLVLKEAKRYFPDFPEPVYTKVVRWDRAVNLESPGQFVAIQDLIKNHMRDVQGLYLAGEYLFLIACTEGALATGQQAANMVMEDM